MNQSARLKDVLSQGVKIKDVMRQECQAQKRTELGVKLKDVMTE